MINALKSKKFYALLILAAAFIILGQLKDKSGRIEVASRSAAEEKQLWQEVIKKEGGEAAHQKFFETYQGLSDPDKHAFLHLFGEALYDVFGQDGIRYCDTRVAYACYHGFMSKPAEEQGLEAIKFYGQECYRIFGESDPGCKHGLGHILLEYLGDDKVAEALEICKTFPVYRPLGGCAGGVYMEYHTFDIRKIENTALTFRPFDEANAYDPCPDLAGEFQPSCYFALAKWWDMVFKNDFTKIGELCQPVKAEENRNSCWQGTGWMAAQVGQYKLAESEALCEKMNSQIGIGQCKVGLAWTFSSLDETKGFVGDICEELALELKDSCLINARKN